MASENFRNLTLSLAKAEIAFDTADFKALLVTAIPNESALDTWVDRADVTGEHPATGGYTTGGFDVTVDSVTLDTGNDWTSITISAPSPTYEDVTLAGVVGCIVYKDTGTAADDTLVSFVDFESTKGVTAGDFNVTFTSPLRITT